MDHLNSKHLFNSFYSAAKNFKFLFLCATILMLCSCRQKIHVTTNAFADPKKLRIGFPLGSSFCVTAINNDNPLLAKDIAFKIEEILKAKSYCISGAEQADYYLSFDYGVTEKTRKSIVPVNTPGGTKTTIGQSYGILSDSVSYTEQTKLPDTITYIQQEYTFFEQFLNIEVCDARIYRNSKQEEHIWAGSAISSGKSSDIREILDYLFVSIFQNFGRDTNKMIDNTFEVNGEIIKSFKKIYSR